MKNKELKNDELKNVSGGEMGFVKCENCGKRFYLTQWKDVKHEGTCIRSKSYGTCPECGKYQQIYV